MKKAYFISHLLLWVGVLCMVFGVFLIAKDYFNYVNAEKVSCQIVNVEKEVMGQGKTADSFTRTCNRYDTYVDYSYQGNTYHNVLIKENCGAVGQTVTLFVDNDSPSVLYQFSLSNTLFRFYVVLAGLLLVTLDCVISNPIHLSALRETRHIRG